MRPAKILAVALWFVLAGCNGGRLASTARALVTLERHVVAVEEWPEAKTEGSSDTAMAFTNWMLRTHIAYRVVYGKALLAEADLAYNCAAHELGHCLAVEHSVEWGWMYPTHGWGEPLIEKPTAAELAQAKRFVYRYDLQLDESVTPLMERATRWAADTWNKALGREVFVVTRAP